MLFVIKIMASPKSPEGGSEMASQARSATRFVALSGLGWLLDTCVYLLLVALSVPVFIASIAGGLSGASFAFLTSSRFVFATSDQKLPFKLAIYLIYSFILILFSAAATHALTESLLDMSRSLMAPLAVTLAAFLAKCAITPFLLTANFFVARAMLGTRSAASSVGSI